MKIFFLIALTISLWGQSFFQQAQDNFNDGKFVEAYSLYTLSAKKENDADAAFYLGLMSEYGIGTNKDLQESNKWYKISSEIHYLSNSENKYHDLEKKRRDFINKLSIDDPDAKKMIEKKIYNNYGFKAHKVNYILPISCGDYKYKSYVPSDSYTNCEAEVQLSIGFDIYSDLLGFNEIYTLGYTQRSFWQIYTTSKPFRETNYNPEFMVTFPLDVRYKDISLTAFTLSYAHQSNGKGNITLQDIQNESADNNLTTTHPEWFENNSRSWDYIEASALFQYKSLFLKLTAYLRIPENEDEEPDDNPDLMHYLGYNALSLYYAYGKSFSELHARYNFKYSRGAVELNWSYPFLNAESTYWYVKGFSGYGESLIDYNNYINKVGFGLSFSR